VIFEPDREARENVLEGGRPDLRCDSAENEDERIGISENERSEWVGARGVRKDGRRKGKKT